MNQPAYLTISALSTYLKRKFDVDPYLKKVYVIGEVSNFRQRPTHQYFSLKDETAKIKVVCYQQVFQKIGFVPTEGMQVLVIGRVSLYPMSGEYQIYIEHMEMAGAGALFQAYKELQEKLANERLFQTPKKSIPRFPKRIAVLTSQSGAVIHDIRTTILRRYPIVDIHIYPTLVQGKESAKSIIDNLDRVERSDYEYDTVIIARGGGSIEDLWSFNEESVVRRVHQLTIPVISSIGHETDTTLTDFVADLRAATPTAAAEHAVPVLNEVLSDLVQYHQRLVRAMEQRVSFFKQRLNRINQSYVFKQSERLYEGFIQKLDRLLERFDNSMQLVLEKKRQHLEQTVLTFEHNNPGNQIDKGRQQLEFMTVQLPKVMRQYMLNQQQRVDKAIQQLDLLSPLKSMSRGYSYVRCGNEVVSSVQQLNVDDMIMIEMLDGRVVSQVKEIDVDVERYQ